MKLLLKLISIPVLPVLIAFYSYGQSSDTAIARYIASFDTVISRVNAQYVYPPSLEKLTRKSIDALFEGLDPFSYFMSPEEAREFRVDLNSKFGGTGIFLGLVDDQLTVMKVFEGNPAQKAGIRVGDQLVEVDGLSVKGKSIEEVFPKLRGLPGSSVSIVLRPAGKNITKKVVVQREEIILSSVPYYGMVDEHFGYIKLTGMTENCSDDVQSAIIELQKQNGLQGIVLDLRGNAGGFFREGTRIANFFIDKGKVLVKVKGRSEETVHYAPDIALAPAVPLVVLVNNVTASSAEILCGALQDNDRAVIIGQKTFGKGLVGKVFPMGNGAEAVITIAFYFTPGGRCIQSKNYWSGQNIAGVADAAKTAFVTANGRAVKEAAGIIPDIEMPVGQELPVLGFLRENHYVFKYATEYVLKNPGWVPGKAVNLPDEEYAAFISGLPSGGIHFNSTTANKLKELKTVAANEGYLNTLEQELTRLEELVQRENRKALELYKSKIKAMLEQEIAAHYGYERGRIANGLRTDAEVQKAIEVLKDREGMRRMLGVK